MYIDPCGRFLFDEGIKIASTMIRKPRKLKTQEKKQSILCGYILSPILLLCHRGKMSNHVQWWKQKFTTQIYTQYFCVFQKGKLLKQGIKPQHKNIGILPTGILTNSSWHTRNCMFDLMQSTKFVPWNSECRQAHLSNHIKSVCCILSPRQVPCHHHWPPLNIKPRDQRKVNSPLPLPPLWAGHGAQQLPVLRKTCWSVAEPQGRGWNKMPCKIKQNSSRVKMNWKPSVQHHSAKSEIYHGNEDGGGYCC